MHNEHCQLLRERNKKMQKLLRIINLGFERGNQKTIQSDCHDEARSIRLDGFDEV